MSISYNIDKLTEENRKRIIKELNIKMVDNKYNKFAKARYINPFEIIEDDIYLPYAYARKLGYKSKKRNDYSQRDVKFEGTLRDYQVEVKDKALEFLNKNGTILISCHCGWGKTTLAIYLGAQTKMKTLILIHRLVIMDQWIESINRLCPNATVQKLETNSVKQDCDFYVMNALNVPKMGTDFFNDIGCCIVDESHNILAETLSKSLTCISPRYLIGLSATPYRTDGLDILFELYYGKDKIVRKLDRLHYVYKIETGFVPEIEMASNGKINWGKVIDSQATDANRNELIIRLVKKFKDRNFLVLCKRVNQARLIAKRLKEENEDVATLIGTERVFNRDSRILVATTNKVSVGFDHPKLNTLLLAGDIVEYYLQVIGRVFRTKETPIIFDLVDNYSILKRHFNSRKKVCIEHGGELRNFKKDCPEFVI